MEKSPTKKMKSTKIVGTTIPVPIVLDFIEPVQPIQAIPVTPTIPVTPVTPVTPITTSTTPVIPTTSVTPTAPVTPVKNEPKQTVMVTLPAKSCLAYAVDSELGGGYNYLTIKDACKVNLPVGAYVEVSGYGYKLLREVNFETMVELDPRIMEEGSIYLSEGTAVSMGQYMGIPTRLIEPLECKLLQYTEIELPTDTVLQMINSPVCLKTATNQTARLIIELNIIEITPIEITSIELSEFKNCFRI